MKKQYIFILLIGIMLYMIYLVLSYKYNEYRIYSYMQNIIEINEQYLQKIEQSQSVLENRNTQAYKNKILKSQQGLKNPGEKVVFLITEEKYKKYTEYTSPQLDNISSPEDISNEKSLIQTMTIYQKWMYLLFGRDTR